MTSKQEKILRYIFIFRFTTVPLLVSEFNIAQSSAKRMLDRLIKKDYLKVAFDGEGTDRTIIYRLTNKGVDTISQYYPKKVALHYKKMNVSKQYAQEILRQARIAQSLEREIPQTQALPRTLLKFDEDLEDIWSYRPTLFVQGQGRAVLVYILKINAPPFVGNGILQNLTDAETSVLYDWSNEPKVLIYTPKGYVAAKLQKRLESLNKKSLLDIQVDIVQYS